MAGVGAAEDTDLSTTATPQQRGPREGRGAARGAWGSVASALTFDDSAGVSDGNREAAATAEAEAARVTAAGVATEGTEAAEEEHEEGEGLEETVTTTSQKLTDTLDPDFICNGPDDILVDFSGAGNNSSAALRSEQVLPLPTVSGTADAAAAAVDAGDKKGGSGVDDVIDEEENSNSTRAQHYPPGGEVAGEEEREGEGGGAAEWWREAMGPTSRRPVTRRSLVSGGVTVGGASNTRCTWAQVEEGKGLGEGAPRGEFGWGCDGMVCGGDGGDATGGGGRGGGGGRRRSNTAAPICGFSTESKHRNLGEFLNRR